MFVCSDRTLATASLVNSIDLDNHCIRVQMFQDCLTTISISIVIWLRGWFVHGQPAQLFVGSLKVEEIRPTHLCLPPAHLSLGHDGLEVAEAGLHQPRPHSHALPSHTTQTQGWSEPLEGGSTTGPASTAARAGLRETGSGLGGTTALAARTKLVFPADDRGRDLETQQLVVPASLAIKASQSLKPPNILMSPTSSTIYFSQRMFFFSGDVWGAMYIWIFMNVNNNSLWHLEKEIWWICFTEYLHFVALFAEFVVTRYVTTSGTMLKSSVFQPLLAVCRL